MNFTKEQLEEFKNDPIMKLFAGLFGTTTEDLVKGVEKEQESCTKKVTEAKVEPKVETEDDDEIGQRIKRFFDKMVDEGKATVTVENGHPHYSIKSDDSYTEAGDPETLVDDVEEAYDEDETSFSMSKEELEEFINDYRDADSTVRKLEHAYGIDLRANEKSIYFKYNEIIWNLIDVIFGSDNRDDIADYVFGDSNFDTVEDLYEELV